MHDETCLTLAVVVNDGPLPLWVHRALSETAALDGVRLALLLSHPRDPCADEAARSRLGRLYRDVDQWWFAPSHALHGNAPPDRELPGVPGVTAVPTTRDEYARLLSAHRIDAVLDLSDRAVACDGAVAQGTWRLSHAGATAETAALSGVLGGVPSVRSVLHSTDSPERVLCESTSALQSASVSRALSSLLWKNVALVRRGVQRLQRDRSGAALQALPALHWASRADIRARELPWRLPAHLARAVRNRWRRQSHDSRWILLTGRRDGADIVDIERVLPPVGHFWADPFVVADESERYVFFEDYRYDLARGHIAVAPIDAAGRIGHSTVALERPYHLSYPWVFQHEGTWYMVPETQANRTVEVYRCNRFPDRWQFSHVLMRDVRAVDATFLQHGGRWWMFANIAEFEGTSTHDDLCAFWADGPLSTNWHPHPLNPVVSDVRRARPAGPFVRRDGRLLRPSQDCELQYGGAVCVNEVVELTETTYLERCIGKFEATWDPDVVAMHTVSELDGLVVLDGKLRTRRGHPTPPPAAMGHCPLTDPGRSSHGTAQAPEPWATESEQ